MAIDYRYNNVINIIEKYTLQEEKKDSFRVTLCSLDHMAHDNPICIDINTINIKH